MKVQKKQKLVINLVLPEDILVKIKEMDMKQLFDDLTSLGYNIVYMKTNKPLEIDLPYIEYVPNEKFDLLLKDVIAIHQTDARTIWIDKQSIKKNYISIVIVNPFLQNQVKENLHEYKVEEIAITPTLNGVNDIVKYAIHPRVDLGELRSNLIDIIQEIKYKPQ